MVNLLKDRRIMDQTTVKEILCIEDEPEMIDLIRLILGAKGFDVHGAAGGMEGIASCANCTQTLFCST
jgi:CheY-like chemotaxis protein